MAVAVAWPRRAGHLAALVLLVATGAAAADGLQGGGLQGDAWGAVGRISYGPTVLPGAAVCTGALVAPDLVLTAGHCLGAGDPGAVRFALGLDAGGARALRRGAEVLVVQGPRQPGVAGLAGDLALLRLDRPVPAAVAVPVPIGAPAPGPAVTAGYRRDAPDAAPVPWICVVLLRQAGILGLSCPAVSGNSGAPLMQRGTEGAQIVAVMVAAVPEGAEGRPRSIAALPGPALRAVAEGG